MLYLPKIYSFIKPKQLCDGPVYFSFGRKVVTDKWVILHSKVFCHLPKGIGYPYHKFLIAVFTPSGTLVDYLLLKENSDEGYTLVQGIAQPYSLAVVYYKPEFGLNYENKRMRVKTSCLHSHSFVF